MIGYLVGAGVAALGLLAWLGRDKNTALKGDDSAFSNNSQRHKRNDDVCLRRGEAISGRRRLHPNVLRRRTAQNSPTRYPWTRQQDLAVLHLQQLRAKGQSFPEDIRDLAWAMNRTEASILMRIGNFDFLDSSVSSTGLSHAAKLTKDLWAEYQLDPQRIFQEASRAYSTLMKE